MDVLGQLGWRYAVKRFDPTRKLAEGKLEILLESARMTASSLGLQPYRLLLVKDPSIREMLVEHAYGQTKVAEASHLLILATFRRIDEAIIEEHIRLTREVRSLDDEQMAGFIRMMRGFLRGKSESELHEWARHQTYIVLGNLLTVCALQEVDACPMEGFKPEAFDRILNLEEKNLTATVLLPVGFRSREDSYQREKKVRKSREDFLLEI